MFDIMTGVSQQDLMHDKGHTPRSSSVTSHVSYSLSFPSQRQRYLSLVKRGINMSGVGEHLQKDSINLPGGSCHFVSIAFISVITDQDKALYLYAFCYSGKKVIPDCVKTSGTIRHAFTLPDRHHVCRLYKSNAPERSLPKN